MLSDANELDEHFCTMFDREFLAIGLALHQSLVLHCPAAVLWVLCLDEETEQTLRRLGLPGLRTLVLQDVETPEVAAVRTTRTAREYYWTLTPVLLEAILTRAQAPARVTYLDADLCFFDSPDILLNKLERGGEVLITHHAYAPAYEHYAQTSGAYCVQFLTIAGTPAARAALAWWRARCIEWCFERFEDGRFGDQRYLESWPAMLGSRLVIVNRADLTGAPWNAYLADRRDGAHWQPVFYHFHGFRQLRGDRVLLFPIEYDIGRKSRRLYADYVRAIRVTAALVRSAGTTIAGVVTPSGLEEFEHWPRSLRQAARRVTRRVRRLPMPIVSIR